MDRATGVAIRKQGTIADALQVKKRSVQRCLERLHLLGHLKVAFEPGRSKANEYALCLERATLDTSFEAETEIKDDPRVHKATTRHSYQSFLA